VINDIKIVGASFSKVLEDGTKVVTTIGEKGFSIRSYPQKKVKEPKPPKETIEQSLLSQGQLNMNLKGVEK